MFAADTLSYTATDKGPCGQFVNTHAESWAAEGRHYIDVTRTQASAWNDAPELDAAPSRVTCQLRCTSASVVTSRS